MYLFRIVRLSVHHLSLMYPVLLVLMVIAHLVLLDCTQVAGRYCRCWSLWRIDMLLTVVAHLYIGLMTGLNTVSSCSVMMLTRRTYATRVWGHLTRKMSLVSLILCVLNQGHIRISVLVVVQLLSPWGLTLIIWAWGLLEAGDSLHMNIV